ncbi:hypothetical protein [Flavobacterium sp.]|uniref:hypothetical protein n=1 Tax=Flavobacterium sp. TaxID=239 RepID=UPI00262C4E4F|nr:hypothetical protein [Flavobacterium sp.]
MKAYTLKKKEKTEEYHLFEGDFTNTGCNSENISICEKMNKQFSGGNVFTCFDENEARIRIAEIGRQVCGICTSHLYTTNY